VTQQVLGEAANRGKATIAGHSAIASLGFDMLQKREHEFGPDVVQLEVCDGVVYGIGQEQEEELESVPIGTDGVLTGAQDAPQMVFEEALDKQ
jgi:hypothetical protein